MQIGPCFDAGVRGGSRLGLYCRHLGDGLVGRIDAGGHEVILPPEWGEFANQTFFLPDATASEHLVLRIGTLNDDAVGFILMSDGAASALYEYRMKALAANGRKIAYWLRRAGPKTVLNELEFLLRTTIVPRSRDDLHRPLDP